MRNRNKNEVSISVFDLDDIERLRNELGNNFWWIPKSETNPRGFGLTSIAVEKLLEAAKEKGNHITIEYTPIKNVERIVAEYWERWYHLVKDLVLKQSQ